MTWDLPRTQASLSRWKCACKGRREGDNRRDGASPAVCTLPIVPCGSSPVARLYLAKNEAPEEADLRLCCNQMWDACWQRFEPRNIDFNKFLFQLQHSKVHSHARITNSVTIFTKQYMLIASFKNLKRYLQFNPDELQWLSGARKSSVTCCQFSREGEWRGLSSTHKYTPLVLVVIRRVSIGTNGTIGTSRKWCHSNVSTGEYASH